MKRTRPLNVIFLLLIVLALGVLFAEGLANIVDRWYLQPEYSHGYLVPLVAAYLLWERKSELQQHWLNADLRFQCAGLALCVLALAIAVAGEISALYLLIHYALLLFLLGLSAILFGRAVKLTAVPIAILAFAIPLPYFVEVILSARLQLLSSELGVALIRLFNIPVYLSGNVIDLGEFKLHVVEACSGLRYLFPLACLGFLAAYFYQAAFWKRALIFLSTIPITIAMNSARIGVTGLLVENFGPASAAGFLHDFEGWVVFVICLLILLLELKLIEVLTDKRSLAQVFRRPPQTPPQESRVKNPRQTAVLQGALLGLLLVAIVGLYQLDTREENSPRAQSLAAFPMDFGSWRGTRDFLAHDIVTGLQFDDYLLANYHDDTNSESQVNFYLAFYQSQRKGVSPHSPKVCIPGGGWEISEFARTSFEGMPVNRAIIRKGNSAQLVYYWFVERGQVVANEYRKKWWLFRDAILLNRSDGALVRVVTPIHAGESIDSAEARIASFIELVQPKLMRYLPPPKAQAL